MTAVATRRQVLAGAAAGAALPALAGGEPAAAGLDVRASAKPVHRGRALAVSTRGRRVVVVAHDARTTIGISGRERPVDVGGRPVDVAITADGRLAAVSTAAWDRPGVAFVDVPRGVVLDRVAAGPAPGRLAFTPRGDRLVVAGGEQEGELCVVDVARRTVLRRAAIGLVPRGLAVTPDGRRAWVALHASDEVVLVDLASGRVRRTIGVPALPDRLALDAEGRRLLLTHGGRAAERVSEVDLVRGRVRRHVAGRQPSAVAWTADGRRLVALGGESHVVEVGRRRRRLVVGAAPRDLAVAGRHLFCVSALTGAVTRRRAA